MLRRFATTPAVNTDVDPAVLTSLKERGYLQKTKAGLFVTPEGLAALLDTVPVETLSR